MSNDRGISVICRILCNSRPPVMDGMTAMIFFILFSYHFNTHTALIFFKKIHSFNNVQAK